MPALLTMSYYAGTLAALRCLSAHGVPVSIASDRALAPAFWSRHARQRVAAPPVSRGPAAIAEWLCAHGREHPGQVLHPTSDDIAWVIARHADALRQHFHLYVPSASTLRTLLDKKRLYDACGELGIPVPKSWFPESVADVEDVWSDQRRLVLKPRAQVFFHAGGKGALLHSREQAVSRWIHYREREFAAGMKEDFPWIQLPLLQEYEPSATQGTYSLTGFADQRGRLLGVRAATKVLQTAHTGIGMCFVASKVDAKAQAHVAALCKHVGFFGAFEVEFVRSEGVYKLIDFNPRYYGQMGFDIARGTPLPWMLQHAALGQTEALDALVPHPEQAPRLYRDRVALTWWLATAVASGALSLREAGELSRSHGERSMPRVDAAWRADDPAPALVAAAAIVWSSLRHPLAFLHTLQKQRRPHQLPLERVALESHRPPALEAAE